MIKVIFNVIIVYDQGKIILCSDNAVSNQILISDTHNVIDFMPSRLYRYLKSILIDSEYILPLNDSGASLRNVYKALLKYNFPSETTY